jgi:hypothetical protein
VKITLWLCLILLVSSLILDLYLRKERDDFCLKDIPKYGTVDDCALYVRGDLWEYGYRRVNGKLIAFRFWRKE